MAVLGTPNIGPNGTIVTNTIYGMGDDDLLQLPRINRNQITVGKFIGKYSTLSTRCGRVIANIIAYAKFRKSLLI